MRLFFLYPEPGMLVKSLDGDAAGDLPVVHPYLLAGPNPFNPRTDLQIIDAIVGVAFTQSASGIVQNCYLSGHQNYGIVANDAGTVVIRNNVIEDCPGVGIGFGGAQGLTVIENIISRTGVCCYIMRPIVEQLIANNHFLRYPEAEDGFHGYYIRTRDYYPFGPYYFDFTNNYWGTTDPEEISTWIYDGHDNSSVWMYVLFEPMADGPVPVQQQTWTEVKGLFRD